MKLKVPATQHHHREHAAHTRWLAISQVQFLYVLPKYKYYNLSDPVKVLGLPFMYTTILTTFYLVFHLVTYETKISLLMKLSDYAIFIFKIANTITCYYTCFVNTNWLVQSHLLLHLFC